jgi:release factor glutamine methyltransferase
MEEHFELKPVDISLHAEEEIDFEHMRVIEKQLKRLKNHEPIQYIIGHTIFYGLRLKVNPKVLIPRPETEELVEWIIEDQKLDTSKQLLDIGTGSGCMAIALKNKFSTWSVTAIDVSEKALDIAKYNADAHQAEIQFIWQDIFKMKSLPDQTQIIVSNPPYVRQLEKAQMHNNVLEHEPYEALFVTDHDPLIFYKCICHLAQKQQHPAVIYFEINQYMLSFLKTMLQDLKLNTFYFRKDFRGNVRFLKVMINAS